MSTIFPGKFFDHEDFPTVLSVLISVASVLPLTGILHHGVQILPRFPAKTR